MLKYLFIDRRYKVPRVWSNKELKKFAHLFTGDIVNISGWKDIDKEGDYYRNYFHNARRYYISNYKSEARGLQGFDNEFYLDLIQVLDEKYKDRFDVVFNHTTLEHIYDIRKAFYNLCLMSKDIVIVIVPFLQQMHSHYGDYWRFTPLTIRNLYEENGLKLLYLSFNNHRHSSVYIFAIGSKKPEKWKNQIHKEFTYICRKDMFDSGEDFIGCKAITNSCVFKIIRILRKIF
jgi:hypothetical protein